MRSLHRLPSCPIWSLPRTPSLSLARSLRGGCTQEDPNHYTNIKATRDKPMPRFLRTYAPPEESKTAIVSFSKSPEMEGALIKGKSARSIYFLDKGVRRPVGGMDIMEARNFTLAQVRGRLGRGEGSVATCAAAARIPPPPRPYPHPSPVSLANAPHRGSAGYSRQ